MPDPLLALDDVRAGYGDATTLEGISLEVPANGSLAVLGRNGVGKSTLLLTIMGLTRQTRGKIIWQGRDITRMPPHMRARAGLGWVAWGTGQGAFHGDRPLQALAFGLAGFLAGLLVLGLVGGAKQPRSAPRPR